VCTHRERERQRDCYAAATVAAAGEFLLVRDATETTTISLPGRVACRARFFLLTFFFFSFLLSSNMAMLSDQLSVVVASMFYALAQTSRKNTRAYKTSPTLPQVYVRHVYHRPNNPLRPWAWLELTISKIIIIKKYTTAQWCSVCIYNCDCFSYTSWEEKIIASQRNSPCHRPLTYGFRIRFWPLKKIKKENTANILLQAAAL